MSGPVRSRLLWSLWAVVPVALLAFHFGPGQAAWRRERAAAQVTEAMRLHAAAEAAQTTAYEAHLATLEAMNVATDDPRSKTALATLREAETKARAEAEAAWGRVADALAAPIDALKGSDGARADRARWLRGRALVRSGRIESGIDELQSLLDDSEGRPGAESLARDVREDLATGQYYKARLLRLGGAPAAEWREQATIARQHFRLLAERASKADAAAGEDLQRNVEVVLNLEQSSLEDLQGKPRPKYEPPGNREGNRPGKGKTTRAPRKGDDRGAGGAGDIGPGW
ncbi:MAG: hypothetical protein WCK33_04095 [Phycisphaerae bacterium]